MKYAVGVIALLALVLASLGLAAGSPSAVGGHPSSAAAPAATSASGHCSKAEAGRVATRLHVGVDPVLGRTPIFRVLCGPFLGSGSEAMVASVAVPMGCGGSIGWAVFRFAGGEWQLVLNQRNGAFLSAAGSDIRERVGAPRPGDPPCAPSAWKARTWHWNGSRFTASPWKQESKGEPPRRGFYSPSRNIACGMFDDSSYSYVNCQSRVPPQNVTMHASGRLTICRDPTPSNVTNDCNLGDPGEGVIPVLAYGKQITVGRFRCQSLPTGVRCTVIRSGKGFLINRDGVSRVGP